MNISQIDRKIIHELQENCRQSSAAIGDKVGLSPSACHRRIGLLEKDGLIDGYGARLNGRKLGFAMTFYLEVTLEGQSEAILSSFEKAALSQPEVLECYLMTGQADYLIKIAASDTADYERVYRRSIASLPHVSRIQSSLVMKTIKRWGGYPTR